MSTFKAEYQKYLDKLKGVDLTSKTSTLTSNVTSCVNNMNNLKSSVSASTWTELGEETFANSVIPSVSTFTSGLSDNIATLEKAASMSKELVDIIESAVPAKYKYSDSHPAKRTFQAIRIEVNNEIKPLYNTVLDSVDCLKKNGRLCIITFHSLEDRAVKKAMQEAEGICTCPPGLPYCKCGVVHKGKVISKKPILPSKEEMEENSRSKSSKLRVFEKI